MAPSSPLLLLLLPLLLTLSPSSSSASKLFPGKATGAEAEASAGGAEAQGTTSRMLNGVRRLAFFFGDDVLDVGNTNYLPNPIGRASYKPYGFNYVPANGRFSDGKVMADYLSGYWGIGSTSPPPNLLPGLNPRTACGVNFATAGAGALDTTYALQTQPLSAQLTAFQTLVSQGWYSPQELASALYVVSIGTNDATQSDVNTVTTTGVVNFNNFLQGLIAAGAQKYIFIGPLAAGCTPQQRTIAGAAAPTQPFDINGCNSNSNPTASLFGQAQKSVVDALSSPTFKAVSLDTFALNLDQFNNPGKYCIYTFAAACGTAPPLNGDTQCAPFQAYNSSTSKFLYWDYARLTQAASSQAASIVWNGNPVLVSPSIGACKFLA